MKFNLKDILTGALVTAILLPLGVYAARTAAPVLTGLFASTQLSVALPAPVISLGNSTTTGAVYSNGGNGIYFAVTASDGVGETVISNMVSSSTGNEAHGWMITWTPVVGAVSYKVYFSTSTPLTLTQYFNATTSKQFSFVSTSSSVFIPTGIPTGNTAYVAIFNSNGQSYVNGGQFLVGTTTSAAGVQFQVSTSTATTTEMIGSKGISGGRTIYVDSSGSHTTCTQVSYSAGVQTVAAVTCP